MIISKITKLFVLTTLTILVSCSRTPVQPNVDDMFPDYVPSNLCYLFVTRRLHVLGAKSTWHSAGTLIEGQYLVTAAHNLYTSTWSKPVNVKVTCKNSSGSIDTRYIDAAGIGSTLEVDHYDTTFSQDYAFIKVPASIDVLEEITLEAVPQLPEITDIEVAGYPGGKLKYGKGPLKKPIKPGLTFKYDVTTAKGMSGGPVWASTTLVGIHGFPSGGRRVDPGLLKHYQDWKARHP